MTKRRKRRKALTSLVSEMEYLFRTYSAARDRVLLREGVTSAQLLLLRLAALKGEATGGEFRRITGSPDYEFSRARKALEDAKLIRRSSKKEDRRKVRLSNTSRGTHILKRIDHAIEYEFLTVIWRMTVSTAREAEMRVYYTDQAGFLRARRQKQLEDLEHFLPALRKANSTFPIADRELPRHYFDERDYGLVPAPITEPKTLGEGKFLSETGSLTH